MNTLLAPETETWAPVPGPIGHAADEWAEVVQYAETVGALNDRLRASYGQLSSLLTLGQAMNAAGSRERVGEILLVIVREVLPYRGAVLLLHEDSAYRRQAAVDVTPSLEAELTRLCEEGALEWVTEGSQAVPLPAGPGADAGAYVFIPLLYQQEFVGVLWLATVEPVEDLTDDRLQVAGVLAGQAAAAFRNAAYADLERSHQQLLALESIKNDLTHMIVHDLRTPLTVIMGNVETAMVLVSEPKERELLQRALAGCEGMLLLIGNLLDISRMEEGKLQLRLERVPIAEVVQPNLDMLAPATARWNKPVVCRFAPDLPPLYADRDLVRRVFANLLSNAIKYSPPDQPVEVDAQWRPESRDLLLSVTDHGGGIPPEYHERIFEKFGQIEAKQSRQRVGSGLGLTFCRMAVEAHGGRIWVESNPGEYTRFLFTLPGAGH